MAARGAYLAAFLALAAGCNCHPEHTTACSAATMAEAQTQVSDALVGNQSCDAGSDCVLLPTPCQIDESPCSSGVAALSLAGQAAVEHAFSVTAAEVCAACTPQLTEDEGGEDCDVEVDDTPGVTCSSGQCTVVALPPDAGSCLPGPAAQSGCAFDELCDFEGVTAACGGNQPYYLVLTGNGACTQSSTDIGISCQTDADCATDESCVGFGEGICTLQCPDRAGRPTFCDGGCELTTSTNGCNLCLCLNGCPPPDGG